MQTEEGGALFLPAHSADTAAVAVVVLLFCSAMVPKIANRAKVRACTTLQTASKQIEGKRRSNRTVYRTPSTGWTQAGACCTARTPPALRVKQAPRRLPCARPRLRDRVSVEGVGRGWHASHRLYCLLRFVVAVAAPIPGRVLARESERAVRTKRTLSRNTGRPFCGRR
jgi:hypothetical protein